MSCSRSRFLGPFFLKPLEASIMNTPLRPAAFSLSSTTMQAGCRYRKRGSGQPDNPLEIAGADKLLADRGFGIAAEQYPMRQDARSLSGAFHRPDNVARYA